MTQTPAARPLSNDRIDDVIDVFSDSFRAYPVMRHVVGPDGDVDARVGRLVRFFVTRRVRRGGPLLGVFDDGALVAAAMLTLPNEPGPGPEIAALEKQVWLDLSDDARARYDAYASATKAFANPAPHHHLNMIGVRESHRGRGLARPLLEAVHRMAGEDPNSTGVSLTTELAKNLRLYQHFGYAIVGHETVTPVMETWGLFRPTPSSCG